MLSSIRTGSSLKDEDGGLVERVALDAREEAEGFSSLDVEEFVLSNLVEFDEGIWVLVAGCGAIVVATSFERAVVVELGLVEGNSSAMIESVLESNGSICSLKLKSGSPNGSNAVIVGKSVLLFTFFDEGEGASVVVGNVSVASELVEFSNMFCLDSVFESLV